MTPTVPPSKSATSSMTNARSKIMKGKDDDEVWVESQKQQQSSADDEFSAGHTTWLDVMCTVYLPLLVVWTRQFIVRVVDLIRMVLLGHVARFVWTYVVEPWGGGQSEESSQHHHSWLVQGRTAFAVLKKGGDAHAWPPPALLILAVLTVFVLVIHPDGTTWIVLGKLRDAMMVVLDSTRCCWDFVWQESSIVPTIVAALTFFALFGMVWILHRTLARKTNRARVTTEKHKKKKRRGHHHPRGGRGRHPAGHHRHRSKSTKEPIPEENDVVDDRLSPPPPIVEKDQEWLVSPNQHEQQKVLNSKDAVESSRLPRSDKHVPGPQWKRPRADSIDSVTTDDQSCETASVRSNTSSVLTSVTSQTDHMRAAVDGVVGDRTTGQSGKPWNRRVTARQRGKKDPQDQVVGRKSPASQPETHPRTKAPSSRLAPKRPDSGRHGHQLKGCGVQAPMNSTAPTFSIASKPESRSPGLSVERVMQTNVLGRQHASPSLQVNGTVVPQDSATRCDQATTPSRQALRLPPGFESTTPASNTNPTGSSMQKCKKMELATFLSQVGLTGMMQADLMEAVDDVEGLAQMSDAQFELYNVTPTQKAQMDLLLDLRRHSTASPMASPSDHSVPLPANLPPLTDCVLNNMAISDTNQLPLLSSPPRTMGLTSLELPSLRSSANVSITPMCPAPSNVYDTLFPVTSDGASTEDEDDASRIEAELQELGGRMVGSVLDF